MSDPRLDSSAPRATPPSVLPPAKPATTASASAPTPPPAKGQGKGFSGQSGFDTGLGATRQRQTTLLGGPPPPAPPATNAQDGGWPDGVTEDDAKQLQQWGITPQQAEEARDAVPELLKAAKSAMDGDPASAFEHLTNAM